jgi:hypothetical protein
LRRWLRSNKVSDQLPTICSSNWELYHRLGDERHFLSRPAIIRDLDSWLHLVLLDLLFF